ncbi:hypothetical protein MRX96_031500 [Rhipicephalus microplus]
MYLKSPVRALLKVKNMGTRTLLYAYLATTTPQPLLCSVSETATLVSLYPDDNLCDIVMYTHVRASKNQIVAVDDMDSYTTFTTVCGVKYWKTTCGISFDAR